MEYGRATERCESGIFGRTDDANRRGVVRLVVERGGMGANACSAP